MVYVASGLSEGEQNHEGVKPPPLVVSEWESGLLAGYGGSCLQSQHSEASLGYTSKDLSQHQKNNLALVP